MPQTLLNVVQRCNIIFRDMKINDYILEKIIENIDDEALIPVGSTS